MNQRKSPKRDFLLAVNYAFKYGSYTSANHKAAEREFGTFVDTKLAVNPRQ